MKTRWYENPLYRNLALVFFLFHLAAITTWVASNDLVIRDRLQRPFRPYLMSFALWQGWNMFESAPKYRSFQVKLRAVMLDGKELILDPLLPDFQPMFFPVRSEKMFQWTIYQRGDYRTELPRLLRGYCRALEERGELPSFVQFVTQEELLNIPLTDGMPLTTYNETKSDIWSCSDK